MRTNTHDNGHGGAYVRKCEVRAFAHVCSPMAFIVALLAVLLVPTIALADSSVIWGPSAIPNAEIGVVVNAPDRYRAAAVALGYGDDAYSAWSDDVKAKLSNASTGGHFYEFAQLFGEVDDAIGYDNPLTAVVSAVGGSFWSIAETLYGDDIWLAGYSGELAAGAASDLSSILSGENIGGSGSSGGNPSTVIPFKPLVATWYTGSYFMKLDNVQYYLALSGEPTATKQYGMNPFTVTLPSDIYSIVPEGEYTYGYSFRPRANGSNVIGSIDIFAIPSDKVVMQNNQWFSGEQYVSVSQDVQVYHMYTSSLNFTPTGGSVDLSNQSFSKSTMTGSPNTFDTMFGAYAIYYYDTTSGSGGGTPVVPPTNWPDEPSAPSPPELPEPGTNPTVTPTPWAPVISPTFDFDLNITTEPTSNDLIDWVKKIYFELRSFHSDEQDWFDEVGKGMDALVDAIDDAQEQIYGELQNVNETLRSEGQKIRDYMYQMFHWLKDQLNFQNDPFDDNNIVYWLKRIWSKLGDGDVNVRPVDPTVDPPAWWEWLNRMLDGLLDGLVGVFNELLGGTGDLLEEVIHQFPFSIPWDIAAFLTALAAPPVTPVFDIVIPAVNGWWSQITFHIDMTPYNTAAATVRLMTKLVFAGLLAWKSRELLNMMDVTKW